MDVLDAIELFNRNAGVDRDGRNITLGIIIGAALIADQLKKNNTESLSVINTYLESIKKIAEKSQEENFDEIDGGEV